MAWRTEKEANGDTAIVIDGWDKGTAPDPYTGTGRMIQVDLTVPGEVSAGYPITANATSGATLAVPIADSVRFFAYTTPGVPTGSPQSFAILDDGGHVFESTSITGTYAFLATANSTTNSSNLDGIAYWLGYLFKTRGTAVDYWNGSTWATFNFDGLSLTGSVKHFMYVATDNVLYITNGNYLASVTAPTPASFDPANAATYVGSVTKLQLPVIDTAISLAEVGSGSSAQSTLLIGGQLNQIYPWDKISSSFGLPINVGDSYIKNMISVNQNVFIFPGNVSGRGRIYITNGAQAEEYFKIPDYIFGVQDPYYEWGDAIFHRNNLIFGFFINNNSGTVQSSSEVWAIDLTTKAFRSISSISSPATGKASAKCLISTFNLSSPGFGYIVAWDDNATAPGIGYSGTAAGTGSYGIITEQIPVGTFLEKKTFSQVEFKLRTPLASGESIQLIPIIDGTAGTSLGTTTFAGSGAVMSDAYPTTFEKAQWLAIQIAATGANTSSGVRLKEIRIR